MNSKSTLSQKDCERINKQLAPQRPIFKNCLKAFLIGGTICLIGQAISLVYMLYFNFTERTVGNPTVATMVFISMLLTGVGFYTKLGQFSGAGSAVPVTGFGNALISAAIEHRTEGYIIGVGGNSFKLAGSVIIFGVFSAFVVALIKTLLSYFM